MQARDWSSVYDKTADNADDYKVANVLDGSMSTCWYSKYKTVTNQWITFDLGSEIAVSRVVFTPGECAGANP